jgi:hypothetical protein
MGNERAPTWPLEASTPAGGANEVSWGRIICLPPGRPKGGKHPRGGRERSELGAHHLPPIMPGTRTRFSMNSATRLMANAEMKYRPVTAR